MSSFRSNNNDSDNNRWCTISPEMDDETEESNNNNNRRRSSIWDTDETSTVTPMITHLRRSIVLDLNRTDYYYDIDQNYYDDDERLPHVSILDEEQQLILAPSTLYNSTTYNDDDNDNDTEHNNNNPHIKKDTRTVSTCSSIENKDDNSYSDERKHLANNTTPIYVSIIYGVINAIIILPILMSFGSIIYRDEAFAPYMPVLIKLTIVSGLIHQLCFSTFSSLPFAVGQVQDAGLIFLSSMASDMVRYCNEQDHDDDVMIATVTVGLSLATALLGIGLVLIGYLQLAQYTKLLPTSVVGGYLAFIGWFCGVSGVQLMAGSNVDVDKLFLAIPGVLCGAIIYMAVRQFRHMAVLPVGIVLVLVIFYMCLWVTDTTVKDATNYGWIREMDTPPVWYHTWDYIKINKADWSAYPRLILTELSMIFVVALSSSLDVAAIELELKQPLNYNRELRMVGLSNFISGLTGGYTGSYIFSQSIFSLRAGIRSRLAGYFLAFCQLVVVVLPFPILAYIPNFFFGALLSMICIDLLFEWLWDVRGKLTTMEYIVNLLTFGLIQFLGVEYGILVGVLLHTIFDKCGFNMHMKEQRVSYIDTTIAVDHSTKDNTVDNYGSFTG